MKSELAGLLVTFLVVVFGLGFLIAGVWWVFPEYETIPSTPMTVSDSVKAVDLQILELQLEREQFSLDSMRMSEYKNVLFECIALNMTNPRQRKWCEKRAKELTRYQE